MHPVKFLFEEINREWGFEEPRRNRREPNPRERRGRRFANLGALLLIR
jgi:hypothetical protein